MLFWNKTKPNRKKDISDVLVRLEVPTLNDDGTLTQTEASSTPPPATVPTSYLNPTFTTNYSDCEYPIDITTMFPSWLAKNRENLGITLDIIALTKKYYEWLTCNTKTDITPDLSFFELEKLKDVSTVPSNLLKIFAKTYFPSLTEEAIENDVTDEELRGIIDNIKVNLYSKKGTPESFQYLITTLFSGILKEEVDVFYPKRSLLYLNDGKSAQTPSIKSKISVLNNSRLRGDERGLWQENSYVVNIRGNPGEDIPSEDRYNALVKPVLHPAGMRDFYQETINLPDETEEDTGVLQTESTIIKNYAFYSFTDIASIGETLGCTYASGGLSAYGPMYVFPDWARGIPSGISFGEVRLEYFNNGLLPNVDLELYYPNDARSCS